MSFVAATSSCTISCCEGPLLCALPVVGVLGRQFSERCPKPERGSSEGFEKMPTFVMCNRESRRVIRGCFKWLRRLASGTQGTVGQVKVIGDDRSPRISLRVRRNVR